MSGTFWSIPRGLYDPSVLARGLRFHADACLLGLQRQGYTASGLGTTSFLTSQVHFWAAWYSPENTPSEPRRILREITVGSARAVSGLPARAEPTMPRPSPVQIRSPRRTAADSDWQRSDPRLAILSKAQLSGPSRTLPAPSGAHAGPGLNRRVT